MKTLLHNLSIYFVEFTQFYGALVQHIFKVLEERDQVRTDEKEWVINEAMNAKNLQHGGTFRNVLSRRVDDVVIPVFSEIIAIIDQNFNLDLIDPKNESTLLSQFWLSMFRDSSIMQFNYSDMVTPREHVPGVGGRKSGEDFKCELPFSWLIHEAVDSLWGTARSSAGVYITKINIKHWHEEMYFVVGNDKSDVHEQLCAALDHNAVGEVLKLVDEFDCEEFYMKYLHDFVRFVHKCNHTNEDSKSQEYEV